MNLTQTNTASNTTGLPAQFDPVIGSPLIYQPAGAEPELFRVLCSCPNSAPRHFTRRHISQNPQDYRLPTVEELQHGNS